MDTDRTAATAINGAKRKEMLVLLLCLIIGFALRFYAFDHKSLWIDEVHTFNDSREGLKGQIKYFKEHPADLLHPPLFYLFTHIFYPFEKPERDLRIIPLVFGTLSIPMIYFLAKLFSPQIALPCTLALSFMAYHISFSQDGRPYSLIMFLGMVGLYFLLRHLGTERNGDLLVAAFFFAILFYTSYNSIPFIVLSQALWFYPLDENQKKPNLRSFLKLNGTTLLFCTPWIIFLILNYKGQRILNKVFIEDFGSLWNILMGVFNDWVPFMPLTIISIMLLILFPVLSPKRMKAAILLSVVFLPVFGLYLFSELFNIQHFFSSKYVINFLPLFFVSIFLSLSTLEKRLEKWNRNLRFTLLFVVFFIVSNVLILPLYYGSDKKDFRGVVSYLESHLRDGDKIYVRSLAYIPGILHYFQIYPESRHHKFPVWLDESRNEIVAKVSLVGQDKKFTIHFSTSCCEQYVSDGGRLWILVGKPGIKEITKNSSPVLKGFFDGSFSTFRKFPEDASMYLFLWDPNSPGEKGIDIPIE